MTILKSKLDVLIAARTIIADEGRWTQGVYSTDSKGRYASIGSEEAVRFCSVGATIRESGDTGKSTDASCDAEAELEETIGGSLADYNDTHTHAEVIAMWDETIRRVAMEGVTN